VTSPTSRPLRVAASTLSLCVALAACGDDDATPVVDAGVVDAGSDLGPPVPVSTAHCEYEPLDPTSRAGGTVTAGTIRAGVGEARLDAPVGTGLGAYTARGLGDSKVDRRFMEIAGSWAPSVGIHTIPVAKALALTAGDETVVFLDLDIGDAFDGMTVDIEKALGPDFHGKVVVQVSHSHSGWGQFTADYALQVGFGVFRRTVYDRMVERAVAAARQALDSRVEAKLGIGHDGDFDPTNSVSRDRRGENNDLPRGDRKDTDLFLLRVDRLDDTPLALVPIFGVHGTVTGGDNPLASTDALGAIERALEESFDDEVFVMHLQGSGGDVSPAGDAGFGCGGNFWCAYAIAEQVGINAREEILALWESTATARVTETKMEMLTRVVPLGPDWETFTIRGGALRYAPWDGRRRCDGVVYDGSGAIASPIDEFNAPYGAALCGDPNMGALTFRGKLPGADELPMYRSCVKIEEAAPVLGGVLDLPPFETPVCAQTRTMLSGLRIGDHVFATVPGEATQLFSDTVRAGSPYPAERTVILGYAQSSVGYLLTPEDWLRGGYEPNITFWGPLEGEYIAERLVEVLALAVTDEREDGTAGGVAHWPTPTAPDALPPADPAPMAGTVPGSVPSLVYWRNETGETLASAQPPATLSRLALARFVFIGEDPLAGTPRVTIERESEPGVFEPLRRRSGRVVTDEDVLLLHTPDPLVRMGTNPRTHYWVVEWQAVPPTGDAALPAVADRTGLPLGRYRIHVEGTGYSVDSDAFEVVPATLTGSASRAGTTLSLSGLGYPEVAKGWRMIDRRTRPGQAAPLRGGTVRVQLRAGGMPLGAEQDATVSDGNASLTAGEVATADSALVTDRFGNTVTLTL
jgi:hypothetical protein